MHMDSFINSKKEIVSLIEQIDLDRIRKLIEIISTSLKNGSKIAVIGNGGSSSNASHFSSDLIQRCHAINKQCDITAPAQHIELLTAIANDDDFEKFYYRIIKNSCNAGDLVIAFSVSGNSKNIIKALKEAKRKELIRICFLGCDGGKMLALSNERIIIRSENYALVESVHLYIAQEIAKLISI